MDWYQDVFKLVFPSVDESAANRLWKKELKKPPKEDTAAEEEDSGFESN